MTSSKKLPVNIKNSIDDMVKLYEEKRSSFNAVVESLSTDIIKDEQLKELVHSIKWRTKDPKSLRKKLKRKALDAIAKNKPFGISSKNLFKKITDLAGIRILHLYPRQMVDIKAGLERLLKELMYITKERIAYTWDEEYKGLFADLGYETKFKPSMYTSVHHVVSTNSQLALSCEIQIRTLMEEVWGEVDHTINYPDASSSIACREQLKALAKISAAGTRLTDSIFASHNDHLGSMRKSRTKRKKE